MLSLHAWRQLVWVVALTPPSTRGELAAPPLYYIVCIDQPHQSPLNASETSTCL